MKSFARGEMLYLEGDTVGKVLLLISGMVKITQLGPKGLEFTLKLAAPGDVLGAVSLFSTGRHCTTAQAVQRCWALVWDAAIFQALSREGLAQMTGTTLYTVSRLLSAWEAHGFVTSRRKSVMINDIRSLRKVIEES